MLPSAATRAPWLSYISLVQGRGSLRFQSVCLSVARGSGRAGSHSVVGEVKVGGNEVICPKVAGPQPPAAPWTRSGDKGKQTDWSEQGKGYETL